MAENCWLQILHKCHQTIIFHQLGFNTVLFVLRVFINDVLQCNIYHMQEPIFIRKNKAKIKRDDNKNFDVLKKRNKK